MKRTTISILTIGIFAFAFTISPVLADRDYYQRDSRSITSIQNNTSVSNENSAGIMNSVEAIANTGENSVSGSVAGDGGNGGAINSTDEVDESTTGTGGDGGSAGVGGELITGAANVDVLIENRANANMTEITRHHADMATDTMADESMSRHHHNDDEDGDSETYVENNDAVSNANRAFTMNRVDMAANTGGNDVGGSTGGDAGNGGAINADDEVDESATGGGGAGGDSAAGGLLQTGEASTIVSLFNVLNRNLTRTIR